MSSTLNKLSGDYVSLQSPETPWLLCRRLFWSARCKKRVKYALHWLARSTLHEVDFVITTMRLKSKLLDQAEITTWFTGADLMHEGTKLLRDLHGWPAVVVLMIHIYRDIWINCFGKIQVRLCRQSDCSSSVHYFTENMFSLLSQQNPDQNTMQLTQISE